MQCRSSDPVSQRTPRQRLLHRLARVALSALAVAMAMTFDVRVVSAQKVPGDQILVRPVRIEGYWKKPTDDPEVIGEVTLSLDGKERRVLGITSIRAYAPAEEGMSLLRHTAQQPVLLVRGPAAMREKLRNAKPDDKIRIFGVYDPSGATFALSSVDVND